MSRSDANFAEKMASDASGWNKSLNCFFDALSPTLAWNWEKAKIIIYVTLTHTHTQHTNTHTHTHVSPSPSANTHTHTLAHEHISLFLGYFWKLAVVLFKASDAISGGKLDDVINVAEGWRWWSSVTLPFTLFFFSGFLAIQELAIDWQAAGFEPSTAALTGDSLTSELSSAALWMDNQVYFVPGSLENRDEDRIDKDQSFKFFNSARI